MHTELDAVGGVSIVPKESIPDVLHAVGYTLAPTAMLTTQHPAELGLKGYPSAHLACTINVRDDDGQTKEHIVQRHLIQTGFGAHVHKAAAGDQVVIPSMHKVVIKLPTAFGWQPDVMTGNSLTKILQQHIPAPSFDSLVIRQDQSATCLVHDSEIPKLLKASGVKGVFFKLHESSTFMPEPHLLWLPPGFTLDDANSLAESESTSIGVVVKNAHVDARFALRFASETDLQHAAKCHSFEDTSKCSRWRLTGLPLQTGAVGALALLESRNWSIHEILYFNVNQCVFLAEKIGKCDVMHYRMSDGHSQQLHLKALNALARQQLADHNRANQASKSTGPDPVSTRPILAQQRREWMKSVVPKLPTRAPAPHAAKQSPPNTPPGGGEKRGPDGAATGFDPRPATPARRVTAWLYARPRHGTTTAHGCISLASYLHLSYVIMHLVGTVHLFHLCSPLRL